MSKRKSKFANKTYHNNKQSPTRTDTTDKIEKSLAQILVDTVTEPHECPAIDVESVLNDLEGKDIKISKGPDGARRFHLK